MSAPATWYQRCLGIAPAGQPPSHYRLLDVQLFEAAPDALRASADRQTARVRAWAGAMPDEALAALIAEIEMARQVLADADSREQYDRHLCASMFPPAIPRPTPWAPNAPAAPAQACRCPGRRTPG